MLEELRLNAAEYKRTRFLKFGIEITYDFDGVVRVAEENDSHL
jgi:hypothetical protein